MHQYCALPSYAPIFSATSCDQRNVKVHFLEGVRLTEICCHGEAMWGDAVLTDRVPAVSDLFAEVGSSVGRVISPLQSTMPLRLLLLNPSITLMMPSRSFCVTSSNAPITARVFTITDAPKRWLGTPTTAPRFISHCKTWTAYQNHPPDHDQRLLPGLSR